MLFSPRGKFRALLRHPALRRGLFVVVGLSAFSLRAAPTLSQAEADRFGRLLVAWNGRVCPMQTLARDFTVKLCGTDVYKGLSAEQVMTGWVFWGEEWDNEPLIRVKNAQLRNVLGVGRRAAFNDFFSPEGGYRLAPYLQDYYAGNRTALTDAAVEVDDRLQLVLALRQGKLWRVFPLADSVGRFEWYAPTDALPVGTDTLRAAFVSRVFSECYTAAMSGDGERLGSLFSALDAFQQEAASDASFPSAHSLKAERLYNSLPLPMWLSRLNLACGLLLMVGFLAQMARWQQRADGSARWSWNRLLHRVGMTLLATGFVALTFYLGLRVEISGRLPLGNGYETMLAISWMLMAVSLALCRRFPVVVPMGLLLSGCFLLVSSLGQMNPQISPLEPVLGSPWLSAHVSLVMAAYALLSFTFACALVAGGLFSQREVQVPSVWPRRWKRWQSCRACSFFGDSLVGRRYLCRSHLGRAVMGPLLGLGSERGLGACLVSLLCCPYSRCFAPPVPPPDVLSCLYGGGFHDGGDDVLGRELFSRWSA